LDICILGFTAANAQPVEAIVKKIACLIVASLLIGCGGGGGGSTATTTTATTTIMGNVAKGLVSGATVNLFILNANGTKGGLLGSTTTDSNGNYSITLTNPTVPVLAEASGGSYVNEVSGGTDILLSTDKLTAVLPVGTTVAAITPLTSMAASRARNLAASGIALATAVDAANAGVAQQYGLENILSTLPVNASNATQVATSSRTQRNYGIILAGITQEASSLNVRPIDLTAALATDMEDGTLDGLGDNTVIVPTMTGGVINLPPDAGRDALQNAINTFLASGNNLTNLVGMSIATVPVTINPLGTSFYINSAALPAAIEGQSYSATLSATGGTPHYTWSVTNGSALPSWLSLNPQGVLSGKAPVLPGGSTGRITPSFSLTCTDNTGLSQAIQETVTIVKAPPTLIPVPGTLMVNQFGSVLVATATGGTPTYNFYSDSFATGAPPLGTSIDLGGHLFGTPTKEGAYSFGICVADIVGATNCNTTSVTVAAGQTTPPPPSDISGTWAGTYAYPTNYAFSANVCNNLQNITESGTMTMTLSSTASSLPYVFNITGTVSMSGLQVASVPCGGGTVCNSCSWNPFAMSSAPINSLSSFYSSTNQALIFVDVTVPPSVPPDYINYDPVRSFAFTGTYANGKITGTLGNAGTFTLTKQ
jgi:3D (Asp-Asp-Asp) domain-containing protein